MLNEPNSRTELSELGEFGLIHHLTKDIKIVNPETLKGVGDDAAVIRMGEKLLLISTDLLVEGVHFDLAYYPLKHLGYKAAVVNFSDIAAMNGTPKQITVGMAVSNRFPVEALEEIYSGILMACKQYKVDLVGGDTTSSLKGLFLSITVTGEVSEEEITYRNTAGESDLICVTGDLGGAYAGLMLLEREKQVFRADPSMQPELEGYDYVLERQLKPEARTEYREIFRNAGIKPTAMIDISDGLASEVLHIAVESGLGCSIYEDKIPMDIVTEQVVRELNMDPSIAALNGGEDYELLFTVKQSDYEKVTALQGVSVIGHMTHNSHGVNMISRSGTHISLNAQGWDAFLRKE
jgi:thiamine-monophosphate kinase